ncbi:unnamed protein product [Peronospora belbahrii]|uniref:Calcineurin-like phosphoesterase domain-containing protein n=1 Tax=Peronospora belbahrii TaxID=622444 RepID=A0AAU9KPH4_9STRA|nr:unnamed protein product [Peronospora belbahrii]CAH0521553.1 unnamed protein product [Peronospora belbahrii]
MTETPDVLPPSSTPSNVVQDPVITAIEPEKHVTGDQRAKIVILSVNDVYDMIPNDYGHGGIAEFATLLEQHKAAIPENVTLLVTLNGDFLSGSEIAERFKGAHMIELMNHLGIEYVVLGNHEFDFGADELKARMQDSSAKWFGSNVRDSASGSLFEGIVDTEIIHLKDGLKLGMFGVCTEETPTLSFPGSTIKFDDILSTSRRCVDALKAQGADFILALTHLSISQDKRLARQVPGINLVLGGHDHEPFTMYEGKTFIHKSGQNAFWLAKLEFDLKRFGEHPERGLVVLPQWSMIANAYLPPQPACQQILYKYMHQMASENDPEKNECVLATLATTLSTRTALLRAGESSGGNLVADALRSELSADVGFINGGFIRGDKEYPAKSNITVGILKHEMPFPRPAVLVRIKASDLRDALIEHLNKYPQQSGSHPHVSGLLLTIDMHLNPLVVTKMLDDKGKPVDLEKQLLVATSKFVADGGDGCSSWLKGDIVRETGKIPDVVADFMMKKRLLAYPEHEGRITILE